MNNAAYKLHRTNAPSTSKAAAYIVDVSQKEKLVLDIIRASGIRGITIKEIFTQCPGEAYGTISARPKALEEKGLIYYAGDKRENARVMRSVENY